MKHKKAIVLVNVGTPDSPKVKDVRKYLTQFLNDRRVIDIPWLFQKILVNLIIVPFRAPKSAKLYQKLWTKEGSPLIVYSERLRDKLQSSLGNSYKVFIAMRYQNPSMKNVFKEIAAGGYDEVQIIPMYPQHADSSTGTTIAYAKKLAHSFRNFPTYTISDQFYNHPGFLNAFVARAKAFDLDSYDRILFSYHGLPMRQIQKGHPQVDTNTCQCKNALPAHGSHCYRGTCYETTRLLTKALEIPKEKYEVAFQSRLSNNWLQPFSDKRIEELGKQGIKKILVFAPAFVADCLETTIEIEDEYAELFQEFGGETLHMVPSLNDSEEWVEGLKQLISI